MIVSALPETVPKADGVNVTEIVQDLPAARDEPQVVLLTANGLPVPVEMLVMEIAAVVFTVTLFAVAVLFTTTLPKLKLVGLSDT